jgi:beta-lactamase regulating signal transducer with metallopeptidase domain
MTAALDQLARISAERLLNSMFEGIAIGLFAWILLQVVGRRNSSTRFAVWFSALLAIAAMPVVGGAASSASPASVASSAITVPVSWALCLFVIWAVGASVALLRVGVGLWQLRKLRANCSAIDITTLDPVLRSTLHTFRAIRSVELRQSDRLQVPTAIGFLKPAVVLPTWAMQDLSTEELNAILIHELAHLRRRDDWTNLAQQIVKALLFFHPAVWWIESKLALEREMACDDAVLAETANPRSYAQCLISMAEKSFLRRSLALAQAAVNRVHQTSLRVSQILDANRSRATRVWKPALYSVAAFFVACLVSLSHTPELVAFKDRIPEVTFASAAPANEILNTAANISVRNNQAVATPTTFLANSAVDTQTHRISDGVTFFAPQNAEYRVPEGATAVPQNAEYRPWQGATPPVPRKADYQMQAGASPAPQNAEYLVRQGASSLAPQNAEYRTRQSVSFLVLQNVEYRLHEGTPSPIPQNAACGTREGTSLLVPRNVENNSGLQPLRQATSSESSSSAAVLDPGITSRLLQAELIRSNTGTFARTTTVTADRSPQAIFVVMQTAQYDEAGPIVWTVCVWHITVVDSTRIPAETRIPAKKI